MTKVRWFTFCTTGSPYEKEAMDCAAAFAKYGIDIYIIPYKATGNWMKNCMQRSRILDECATLWKREPIGLIDADIRPVEDPVLMKKFSGDFAAHYRGPAERENRRYCAGVLIFGGSEHGREVLYEWAELCRSDPSWEQKVREQYYLAVAADLVRFRHLDFKFTNLGEPYNRSQEEAGRYPNNTVLIHYEASRFHGTAMGGPLW